MGIKIDLITGLTIVAIIGVLVTTQFIPALGGSKAHASPYQSSSAAYQVAYKHTKKRK